MNRILLLCGLALLIGCDRNRPAPVPPPNTKTQPAPLLPNTHRATLAVGETHRFTIDPQPHTILHIQLDQNNIDAALTLTNPAGRVLAHADEPTGPHGPEELWLQADTPHPLTLNIIGGGRQNGAYTLTVTATDAAQPNAQARLDAFQCQQDPQFKPNPTSLAQAVERWRAADEPGQTAMALYHLAEAQAPLDRQAALSHMTDAWVLLRAENQPIRAMLIANRLAYHHRLNGDPDQAETYLEAALYLARLHRVPWWEGFTLKNLGINAFRQAQTTRALDYFKQAATWFQRLDEFAQEEQTCFWMARTLVLVGRFDHALDQLNRAETLQKHHPGTQTNGSIPFQRGWIAYRRGDYATAEHLLRKALAAKEKSSDHHGQAAVYDRLGTLYRAQAFYAEAEGAHRTAQRIFEELGRPDQAALAHLNLNLVLADAGRWDAVDVDQDLAELVRMGNREGQVWAYHLKALKAQAADQTLEALGHMEAALTALEQVRGPNPDELTVRPYLSDRYQLVDTARALLFTLHDRFPDRQYDHRALALTERFRARTLREHPRTAGHDPADGDRVLQTQINQLEQQRLGALTAGQPERAQALSATLRDRLQEQSARDPLTPQPPASLSQIRRQLLDGQTRLLVYALHPTAGRVQVVGPESLITRPLAAKEEIIKRAALLNQAVLKHNRVQADLHNRALSRLLLEPIGEEIRGKHLLIVADDGLNLLPFAMLRGPQSDRYLIQDHVIGYLPSGSVGVLLKQRAAQRGTPQSGVVIFADPDYSGADPVDLDELKQTYGPLFPAELPWSRREAERIAQRAPVAELLMRHQASLPALMRMEGNYQQVRHFAVHGLIHQQDPLSGLVLATEDGQGYARHGFVRLHQLERMDLPADLTVLSTCDSARGPQYRGEGPIGLGRALLISGSTRVLMTAWRLRDGEATATLMDRFYQGLFQEGLNAAEALQHAQIHMLEKEADPQNWAALMLTGPLD